jgi:hypothetical protein
MRSALLMLLIAWSLAALGQQISVMVAPFDSAGAGDPEIGKKASIILNLQIWQTLRIPPAGEGRKTKGTVTWDVTSKPPTSYAEAEALARTQTEDEPQIVLWGRAWRYGGGNVVEAFLSIRSDAKPAVFKSDLWNVSMPDGTAVGVGVPRRQVDFRPIVLRPDLLAELKDPSGLKLYASPSGDVILSPVGDYFRALQQGPDSAQVILPDGTKGWVRLPNLSRERSEVVHFAGALVRVFRQDWSGARELFVKVVNNPNAPAAVKIDSYLYLAVAEDKSGGDPDPWLRKAYELNPYSKIIVQYMCMSHLATLSRMSENDRRGDKGAQRRRLLNQILETTQPLFPRDDGWIRSVKTLLEKLS